MQRGASSEFRDMLPMQRGARFAVLWVRSASSGGSGLVGLDLVFWIYCLDDVAPWTLVNSSKNKAELAKTIEIITFLLSRLQRRK